MAQTVTDPFKSRARALARSPQIRVNILWDGVTEDWSTDTDNLVSFSPNYKLADFISGQLTPLGNVDSGRLVLHNTEGRYTPWNEGAGDKTIHSYIGGATGVVGLRVQLEVAFDVWDTANAEWVESGEWCRVFTGYLYSDAYDPKKNLVSYALRDNTWPALQLRDNTQVLEGMAVDELIKHYADLAGLTYDDAGISKSSFVIPLAWLDDDSVLNDIQEIAASVAGFAFCSNDGKLKFETIDQWVDKSVEAVLYGQSFEQLPYTRRPEDLASKVVVEYSPRYITTEQIIYELDEAKQIDPLETTTFLIRLQTPAVQIQTDLEAGVDFWFTNSGSVQMNTQCSIELADNAQTVQVTLSNASSTVSASLIYLTLSGIVVEGAPTGEVVVENEGMPIERVRSVRGNFYLQTQAQSEYIAVMLADRTKHMLPFAVGRNAPALPWLEVGDKVQYQDGGTGGISEFRTGFVSAISMRFNEIDFTQDITITDAEPWYIQDNYFHIGITRLAEGVSWY